MRRRGAPKKRRFFLEFPIEWRMQRLRMLFFAALVFWECLGSKGLGAQDASVLFEPTSQIPASGGPAAKIAFFPSGNALLSGGTGAVSLGDGVGLGLGGYSLASDFVPVHETVKYDLGYSYGGVIVNYTYFPHKLWSVYASVLAGPAQGWSVARVQGADRIYANFVQIEPELDVMLNVTHELRLGLGVSWRFCGESDLSSRLGTDLGGGGVTITMLYGQN
jgi:hypothetical protein